VGSGGSENLIDPRHVSIASIGSKMRRIVVA
jgi:hypothetical protein